MVLRFWDITSEVGLSCFFFGSFHQNPLVRFAENFMRIVAKSCEL